MQQRCAWETDKSLSSSKLLLALQPILKEFSHTLASQDDWQQWQYNAPFSGFDVFDLCQGKGATTVFLLIYLYITLNLCLEDKIKINNSKVWFNSVDTKKNVSFAKSSSRAVINPLNAELNPIWYLLALLGAHHFLHVSRIRVKSLTLRLLMSYIYIWSTYSWCF